MLKSIGFLSQEQIEKSGEKQAAMLVVRDAIQNKEITLDQAKQQLGEFKGALDLMAFCFKSEEQTQEIMTALNISSTQQKSALDHINSFKGANKDTDTIKVPFMGMIHGKVHAKGLQQPALVVQQATRAAQTALRLGSGDADPHLHEKKAEFKFKNDKDDVRLKGIVDVHEALSLLESQQNPKLRNKFYTNQDITTKIKVAFEDAADMFNNAGQPELATKVRAIAQYYTTQFDAMRQIQAEKTLNAKKDTLKNDIAKETTPKNPDLNIQEETPENTPLKLLISKGFIQKDEHNEFQFKKGFIYFQKHGLVKQDPHSNQDDFVFDHDALKKISDKDISQLYKDLKLTQSNKPSKSSKKKVKKSPSATFKEKAIAAPKHTNAESTPKHSVDHIYHLNTKTPRITNYLDENKKTAFCVTYNTDGEITNIQKRKLGEDIIGQMMEDATQDELDSYLQRYHKNITITPPSKSFTDEEIAQHSVTKDNSTQTTYKDQNGCTLFTVMFDAGYSISSIYKNNTPPVNLNERLGFRKEFEAYRARFDVIHSSKKTLIKPQAAPQPLDTDTTDAFNLKNTLSALALKAQNPDNLDEGESINYFSHSMKKLDSKARHAQYCEISKNGTKTHRIGFKNNNKKTVLSIEGYKDQNLEFRARYRDDDQSLEYVFYYDRQEDLNPALTEYYGKCGDLEQVQVRFNVEKKPSNIKGTWAKYNYTILSKSSLEHYKANREQVIKDAVEKARNAPPPPNAKAAAPASPEDPQP